MERLLEKSLDDQFAIERERKAAEEALNKRLIWAFLPFSIAMAIAAMYLDISTRIAIPVLIDLQDTVTTIGQRASYDVFRLDLHAFARIAPASIVAGVLAGWLSVWAGTFYRRDFIVPMYVLIGIAYAGVLTGLLALLIPLNMFMLDLLGMAITDSEIPHSGELALSNRKLGGISPLSYVISGFERAAWAAGGMVLLGLLGIRLVGGLETDKTKLRAIMLNSVLAIVALIALLSGPIAIHQFLFDRFVQPPEAAMLIVDPLS